MFRQTPGEICVVAGNRGGPVNTMGSGTNTPATGDWSDNHAIGVERFVHELCRERIFFEMPDDGVGADPAVKRPQALAWLRGALVEFQKDIDHLGHLFPRD